MSKNEKAAWTKADWECHHPGPGGEHQYRILAPDDDHWVIVVAFNEKEGQSRVAKILNAVNYHDRLVEAVRWLLPISSIHLQEFYKDSGLDGHEAIDKDHIQAIRALFAEIKEADHVE